MLSSNTSAANGAANYIEDVFSTWLYTGNGSTQTITNGIDLAGKGGLVWIKSRQFAYNHSLTDTARGVNKGLASNTTSVQVDYSGSGGSVTAFNSTGFSLGSRTEVNDTGTNASWTFRKQPKFFDVVTYTGDGVAGRTVAHNLGSVPGCIIVKRTNTTSDWQVYHTSLGNTQYLALNNTFAALTGTNRWNSTTPTSTVFTLGNSALTNNLNDTYVAYLFAHNAGGFGLTGTDNVISCGSFTSDSNGRADVNLGYEPQFVITKITNTTGNWETTDTMRGLVAKTGVDNTGPASVLFPNLSNAETIDADNISVTPTGFYIKGAGISNTYIYIAIRRGPMKVPTTGTSVFSPNISSGATGTAITTNFPVDMQIGTVRSGFDKIVVDRLRGVSTLPTDTTAPYLRTNLTSAETSDYYSRGWDNTGFQMPLNLSSASDIFWSFRRAPGFFDEVCYTGNDVTGRLINHSLAAVPELIICKARNGGSTDYWWVYHPSLSTGQNLKLESTAAPSTGGVSYDGPPTSTVFKVRGSGWYVNNSGTNYVAYLFASCPGVSKCGSYTGTGTTLQINCGFTAGARFVLIKRTDSTGDWYVWDSARGIVSGNDPYLLLNSTAAEVTSTDYVDTYSAGFEISSTAPAAINASGGTFIFLAIA